MMFHEDSQFLLLYYQVVSHVYSPPNTSSRPCPQTSLTNSHFLPLLILRLCPLRQRGCSSIPDYALVTRLVELWRSKYLLRVGNTFTCNVEAELHEIEIDSIDVTRKAEGCRRMHYYNGFLS
nr:hypothetical protein CFP56_47363 [Quercus suber]